MSDKNIGKVAVTTRSNGLLTTVEHKVIESNLPNDIQETIDKIEQEKKKIQNSAAISYINNLEASYIEYGMKGLKTQINYILANIEDENIIKDIEKIASELR